MLTKLRLHNFKRFDDAEIELGDAVVFIGPNNSGKTTALQALTLWDIGLHRWLSKRRQGSKAEERAGVAVNRRDLLAVPVPSGRLLWRDLDVRKVTRQNNQQSTKNVLMNISVEGITAGVSWQCGLEFDYTNEESFYVRPLRLQDHGEITRMPVPEQAAKVRIAYLPPMSGLASEEIENYFATKEVLMRWIGTDNPTDLFSLSEREKIQGAMTRAITRVTEALALYEKTPWSPDTKASDDVMVPIFRAFFQEQGQPVLFRKADYYQLVKYLKPEEVDPEVIEKLDMIVQVAQAAKPLQ